jgi:hypothetical protein
MKYEKIYLFGKKQSKGSFDDFFDTEKYSSIEQAWEANDYVECDFVKNESGTLFIEARHSKKPESKLYHELNFQRCPFGLDVSDDSAGCELANQLLKANN